MLRELQLNFFPTALGQFKWSDDGQLCIPVRDQIYILASPALNPHDHSPAPVSNADKELYRSKRPEEILQEAELGEDNAVKPNDQFHYSTIELSENEPEVPDIFRVQDFGLSIANRPQHVAVMEWSPLGVGTFKRCVLAVLTTCFKLYFYEPRTLLGKRWEKIPNLSSQLHKIIGSSSEAKGQIRNMAWSKPCPLRERHWGQSILAMSTIDGRLMLFEVYEGHVKGLVRVQLDNSAPAYLGGVKNLCWSPWTVINENKGQAWLTYSIRDRLLVQRITLEVVDSNIRCSLDKGPVLVAKALTLGHTPMAALWYPKTIKIPKGNKSARAYMLAVALHTEVRFFTFDATASGIVIAAPIQINEIELIDMVTGFVFNAGSKGGSVVLNIATVGGTMAKIEYAPQVTAQQRKRRFEAYCLDRDDEARIQADIDALDYEDDSEMPDWITLLRAKRDEQMEEFDLIDASSKVYGMAVAPFSGVVAVIYRRKPQGYLEYIIKEAEEVFISFETPSVGFISIVTGLETMKDYAPAARYVSTEAFVADLQNFVWHSDGSELYSFLESALSERFGVNTPCGSSDIRPVDTIHAVQANFVHNLFMLPSLTAQRLRKALGLVRLGKVSMRDEEALWPDRSMLEALVLGILQIPYTSSSPGFYAPSSLSLTIIHLYSMVGLISFSDNNTIFEAAKARIEEIKADRGDAMHDELIIIQARETANKSGKDYTGPVEVTGNTYEFCTQCKFPIHFKDFQTAECSSGHRFRRCSMTLLALQDPHKRACGICAREYLSERLVKADEVSVKDSSDLKPTLARALYQTLDICIFCGGHLYDKTKRYGVGPTEG